MKTICLYSELDTFSGYIRHDTQDIAKLIRDLKLACLFYDQVIVNTPVIVEHPLTLPAFEVLSPFVHSGILWTSTKNKQEMPFKFVHQRMMNFSRDEKNKNTSLIINKSLDRWEEITPNYWSLFRNVNTQVSNATGNIIKNLSALEMSKADTVYKHAVLEILHRMKSDNIFDRDYMLAKIVSFKGELSLETANNISILVQSEYINQGVHSKGHKIVLFPGNFVCITNRTLLLKNYLPVDLTTLPTAIRRFQKIGYSIKSLLTIPVDELFCLATSKTWIDWRRHLLSDQWKIENEAEMLSLFLNKMSLSKASDISYKNIKPASVSILPKWQLMAKSGLGTVSQSTIKHEFILDIKTRILHLKSNKKEITLAKSHLNLLSALISSGNIGLCTEQVKQFDVEKRLILNSKSESYKKNKKNGTLDKSTLNRLYVLKNRINKKISPLEITVLKSLWLLKLPEGSSISLRGSAWETKKEQQLKDRKTPKLSSQNKKIYLILKQNSPAFLNSEKIIAELGLSSENSKKKLSDAIYRLEKQLNNSTVKIIRDYNGGYALIDNQ